MLDFTSCADHLGKPTAADLKLGLATGPVLFACRQVSQQESISPKQKLDTALHSTHRGPAWKHHIYSVMSMVWARVRNECIQHQLDLVCPHAFFQTEKHLPTQLLLPLGPCLKSSTSLLLPQFKCSTFAKQQVFREFLHVFCRLFLRSFLLMFFPETSCSPQAWLRKAFCQVLGFVSILRPRT